ncbi:hypothetical protein NEOLEDRAFT_1128863 [Neolentinus lepideus HHB14362 ss-1]|uniref:Uncharacterized protein n=1 Tax=Neolentinus lepideus HHB14362 ss-1 TaxID=1314782 RepID=A0A165UTU0_9AGAM|nr:hypothetical protein NEOLEDRAFT_1128863 [Neolentinus lepideus HHB14362 ss-1]
MYAHNHTSGYGPGGMSSKPCYDSIYSSNASLVGPFICILGLPAELSNLAMTLSYHDFQPMRLHYEDKGAG